jgi:hypothetical protein
MDSLEQIQGMPPGMYHRYGVLDDMALAAAAHTMQTCWLQAWLG